MLTPASDPGLPPALNDRALRYFLAVVRRGSMRAAAAELRIAAAAVSRQVAELEAWCGQPLLERLPRGVRPTEAGLAVAEHARHLASETERLQEELRRLRGGQQGLVRLACGDGFLADLLHQGLAGFAAAHPGLRYQVQAGGTDRVQAALAEGEAELGLAYHPLAHPLLRSAALAPQPLLALMAPSHPLAAETGPLRLQTLAAIPAALPPASHGIRQLLGRQEAAGGFHLTAVLESGSLELLRHMALAGLGITFLPGFAAATELASGQLVARPLADPPCRAATAHLLVRQGRRLPEGAARLCRWLAARMVAFRPAR